VAQEFWELLLGDFEIGIGKARKNPQKEHKERPWRSEKPWETIRDGKNEGKHEG